MSKLEKESQTFLFFNHRKEQALPRAFRKDDNRYPEALVRFFLKKYTKKGKKIFDPFAGFGTTMNK